MYTSRGEPNQCVSTYIMSLLCELGHYRDKVETQKANTLTFSNY